ncbi:SOS response-associated peptidase [Corynebacterium aquilae]|uniref:SOS response-associated peptidase n=1 Tax=Corynebacterium aquilae TaxID=203263 RepID=UPI0009525A77|nr:SOS response-associated peptidase [Corynebacterium aquilae]
MCGRFVLYATPDQLQQALFPISELVSFPHGLPPARFNIAPSTPIPAIIPSETLKAEAAAFAPADTPDQGLTVVPATWGLIPHWADKAGGYATFNARIETAAEKPTFRSAMKKKRCLVPMNGYYEWKNKQPYYVHSDAPGESIVWAAGLFDTGANQLSCTIMTTQADPSMEWLHARMPMFVAGQAAKRWLAGEDSEPEFFVPEFAFTPVDRAVGNVRTQGENLITPVAVDGETYGGPASKRIPPAEHPETLL